jgi:protein ImuA
LPPAPLPSPVADRAALIGRLRTLIAQREGARPRSGTAVSLAAEIDAVLPAAGLARGAIHEVVADGAGPGTAFCALILGRAGGPAIWIEDRPELYPHGMLGCGLDPAALVVVRAGGVDALWAAEEALRCPAVTAVAAVLPRLDLISARRLQLAAEAGNTLGLILRFARATSSRRHSAAGRACHAAAPSAARTRWRIMPLPGAPGPAHLVGAPQWRIELLHARGGRPAGWDVALHGSDVIVVAGCARPAAHV